MSNRIYDVLQTARLEEGFTQVVQAAILSRPPVKVSTLGLATAVSEAFFRVAVRAP